MFPSSIQQTNSSSSSAALFSRLRDDDSSCSSFDFPPLLASSSLRTSYKKTIDALCPSNFISCVCAVCSSSIPLVAFPSVTIASHLSTSVPNLARLRYSVGSLSVPASVTAIDLGFHYVSCPSLDGLILSDAGLVVSPRSGDVYINICSVCFGSLKSACSAVPKYSLANDRFTGSAPTPSSSVLYRGK